MITNLHFSRAITSPSPLFGRGEISPATFANVYSTSARIPLAYERINAVIQPALQRNSPRPHTVFPPFLSLSLSRTAFHNIIRACPVCGGYERRKFTRRNERVVTRFVFRYYRYPSLFIAILGRLNAGATCPFFSGGMEFTLGCFS